MRTITQRYWRNSNLPFLELRSTDHSHQSYKPHFHLQLSFGAVIAGKTRAICNGRELLLQQGDLVLIAPHAVHSCNPIARQPRSYHMLYLDETWCLENVSTLHDRLRADICSNGIVIKDSELFTRYLTLAANIPNLLPDEAAAQLQSLLTDAVNTSRPATQGLQCEQSQELGERIKQALLGNLTSPPTLDELARTFGRRKETLIRIFRRVFHTTPHAFVNNARIERAKQLLKLGENIADVAADLGFSDQAQLHRAFVNYTASTPGQYRHLRPATSINFRQ